MCTPNPSEDSDQLKSPKMGSEPWLSALKRFKSLGMQRVENDGFEHIEGWMQKIAHCLFYYGASFSFHVITLLKSGVT